MDILFGVLFGSLAIVYGVLIIIDPIKFSLGSVNDKWQRAIYGKKVYIFLARFVGGPLAIVFGVLMVLAGLGMLN